MDGFKTLPKMKCFKVGGSVQSEAYCGGGKAMKKGGEVDDKKQDKAMIKKAFKQHDRAEHDKEPTEIKLKKGGRSKKEVGTVKKFKDGSAVYGVKKDSTDKKEIAAVKKEKPKMLKAGGKTGVSDVEKEKSKKSGDAVKMEKVKPTGNKKADAPSAAGKGGKTIKKFATGGSAIPDEPPFNPQPFPQQPDPGYPAPGYGPYNPNMNSNVNSNSNSNSNMNNNVNNNTNTNTNTNNSNDFNTGFGGGLGGGGFGGRPVIQPPVQIDPGYGDGPYPDGPQVQPGSPDLMANLFGKR
jgi:hypothetical protein